MDLFVRLLNSNFSAAMFGALFGAVGAHWIALRHGTRQERIVEIRNTNAAISLMTHVCNSFCSLKRQYVRGLMARYNEQRTAAHDFNSSREANPSMDKAQFHFQIELQTLPVVDLPVEQLHSYLFDKISPGTRALSLMLQLVQSIGGLRGAIEEQNLLTGNTRSPTTQSCHLYMSILG